MWAKILQPKDGYVDEHLNAEPTLSDVKMLTMGQTTFGPVVHKDSLDVLSSRKVLNDANDVMWYELLMIATTIIPGAMIERHRKARGMVSQDGKGRQDGGDTKDHIDQYCSHLQPFGWFFCFTSMAFTKTGQL